MSEDLEDGKCTWDPSDVDDMVEWWRCIEGHGEGGVDALSDLFKSGLPASESMLDRLVQRVPGGEDELEEGGTWGSCLSSAISFPWMFSCRAAWDNA